MIAPDVSRLEKLDRTIHNQRSFLHRIPDAETRERAEGNLVTLILMREAEEQLSRRESFSQNQDQTPA